MHELSIAYNVIEIVEEEAKTLNAKHISEVELEIGLVSGVIPETLKFALEAIVKNTMLENAKIIINSIEGKARCSTCSHEFLIDELYAMCPECNSFHFDVIQGKEMKVKNFIVE